MMTNKEKKTARIVGALFLIAIVASLVGGIMIETVISVPDFLAQVSANGTTLTLSVLLELINGVCVIGIAVLLFPFLKLYDEGLALGYVALRTIEAAIIIAAVISPLALVALSQEAGAAGSDSLQATGYALIAVRTLLVGEMTGIFFSLAALLLFYLLYKTQLVPSFISIWGLIAVALVLLWNVLELIGIEISFGMVLALPMILNEIFLALWLIIKGFRPTAVTTEPASFALQES